MTALPISLQNMISESKIALENRDPSDDESESDAAMEAAGDFLERLSRGEYSQELYWRCQAEDREVEGDWDGALESYKRILDIEGEYSFAYWQAHNSLANLYDLLGHDNSALEHFRLATKQIVEQIDSLLAKSFVNEIWALLKMGQLNHVKQHLKSAHAVLKSTDGCKLFQAELLIAQAAYYVASEKNRKAMKLLTQARDVLESERDVLKECFPEESPGEIVAYSLLWSVEAELCRFAQDSEAELLAWQHSLERARYLAADDPISIVFAEQRVMRRLLSLGEACQRHGQQNDSEEYFAEAGAIRFRRKFPVTANRPIPR